MTINEAIKEADNLRPNSIELSFKLRWLQELDIEIGQIIGGEYEMVDIYNYEGSKELLMPAPYESIYPLYLMAMIDNMLQDTDLYVNDSIMANQKISEAKAYLRREKRPSSLVIGGVFH